VWGAAEVAEFPARRKQDASFLACLSSAGRRWGETLAAPLGASEPGGAHLLAVRALLLTALLAAAAARAQPQPAQAPDADAQAQQEAADEAAADRADQAADNAAQAAQLQVQAQRIQALEAQVAALQSQLTALQSQLAEAQGTANAVRGQLQAQDQVRAEAEAARQQRLVLLDQATQSLAQAAALIQQGVPDEAVAQVGDAQAALSDAAASANRFAQPREATAEQYAVGALSGATSRLDTENGMYAQQNLAAALQYIEQARAFATTP
jgi:hypothetical protein